jgi:cytochrome P450
MAIVLVGDDPLGFGHWVEKGVGTFEEGGLSPRRLNCWILEYLTPLSHKRRFAIMENENGDPHPDAQNLDTSSDDDFRRRLAEYNIYDPAVQEVDLGPWFNRVREECPIARGVLPAPYWIVSRYEDVHYVLQHPELFSSKQLLYPWTIEENSIAFNMDPPEQAPYHRIMAQVLSAGKVRQMEPIIRRHAQERLAVVADKGSCEFVSEFATPMVIGALLECCGLSSDRLADVLAWMSDFFTKGRGQADPSLAAEYPEKQGQAEAYIAEIIEQRKGGTDTDPITEMTKATVDGRPANDEELLRMATFMVLAGVDTTATMTSNIVAWLAEHPDRQHELRSRPDVIVSAIEEFLRYEHMLSNGRVVTQDTELRGFQLRAGDRLMMLLPATGRDPRVFDCPEEIRFDRSPNPHLGFGSGVHRCIGIHLARAEMRIALEEWHREVRSYRVDPAGEIRRRRGAIAGVWNLPLLFET